MNPLRKLKLEEITFAFMQREDYNIEYQKSTIIIGFEMKAIESEWMEWNGINGSRTMCLVDYVIRGKLHN